MNAVLALRTSFSLALLLVIANAAFGYDGATQVGETGKRIVAFVRQANEEAGFRGVVLAARDGKVIASVAVGSRGDGSGEPLRVDTLFDIASCTKSFTAIAVMKLVEEGRINLDDSIAEYLPGIPDSCRSITVRHLLQHTSGIPGTNSEGYGDDLANVLPAFLQGGPRNSPGEKHEYWNQGYSLLSEVIARSSRQSYTRYIREAIFKPCKMKNSRFTGQRAPHGISVATGESTRGADRTALDHPYGGEYGFQYRGMGGLVTNLIDLWHWDRTLARGELLNSESLKEMTEPGKTDYALGWRIKQLDSGATVHRHTGRVRGFLALIQRNPVDDGCLFVLSNSDASVSFDIVCNGCENLLEGKDPPAFSKLAIGPRLAPSLVAELVGTYRDKKGRTLTVRRDGRHAKVVIDWHGLKTRGYLGATDGDGLVFGMMNRYDPQAFAAAEKFGVERDKNKIVALLVTAGENQVRFARTKDK